MDKYVPLDKIETNLKKNKLQVLLDQWSFKRLFILWISIIIGFGFIYYFNRNQYSDLIFNRAQGTPTLFDSIYYSFITGTSTGYGDILPLGINKFVALCEVIISLTTFAIVTSKLVSIKQQAILNEIYEISYHERANRLRSSLYLFRVDVDKIISRIEEKAVKKRETADLWTLISFFENALMDVSVFYLKKSENEYTKSVDSVNLEIILNSINMSYEKIIDLLQALCKAKVDWQDGMMINIIQECFRKTNIMYEDLEREYPKLKQNIINIKHEYEIHRDKIKIIIAS